MRTWAAEHDVDPLVVWEQPGETADEWIVREAVGYVPYWLVTSDRELRELAGPGAARVIGGGSFAQELLSCRP